MFGIFLKNYINPAPSPQLIRLASPSAKQVIFFTRTVTTRAGDDKPNNNGSCLRGLPLLLSGRRRARRVRQTVRREGRRGKRGIAPIGPLACYSRPPRPLVGCCPAALSFHLFGAPISSRCCCCCCRFLSVGLKNVPPPGNIVPCIPPLRVAPPGLRSLLLGHAPIPF